jgi:hypothetical protein
MTEEAEAGADTSVSHGGQIASRFASDSVGDEAELSVVRAKGKDARREMKHEHTNSPDVEGSCYCVACTPSCTLLGFTSTRATQVCFAVIG